MNSVGRPPLVKGEIRRKTSVSLTHAQQIQLRRLGGSRWLQKILDGLAVQPSAQPVDDQRLPSSRGVHTVWHTDVRPAVVLSNDLVKPNA